MNQNNIEYEKEIKKIKNRMAIKLGIIDYFRNLIEKILAIIAIIVMSIAMIYLIELISLSKYAIWIYLILLTLLIMLAGIIKSISKYK